MASPQAAARRRIAHPVTAVWMAAANPWAVSFLMGMGTGPRPSVEPGAPKGLVHHKGYHHRRHTGPHPFRSRPCAAVVDHSGHAGEEPAMGCALHHAHMGWHIVDAQTAPPGQQDTPLAALGQGLRHQPGQFLRVLAGHAAETDVDRRIPRGPETRPNRAAAASRPIIKEKDRR